MSTCNIIINQQEQPTADISKDKDPKKVAQGLKLAEWNKREKQRLMMTEQALKDGVTLKSFIEDFKRDLATPEEILIAMEETIRIMKEDNHKELCLILN